MVFARGREPIYDETTRERLLAQLDQAPPKGHALWTGPLLAHALGDVSTHQVWRELRALGISLTRRRSWCVSTDPEFAQKAADIVGLYLAPPDHALVFAVDEKLCLQALERQQGWLRLPSGQALGGFQHDVTPAAAPVRSLRPCMRPAARLRRVIMSVAAAASFWIS